MTASTARAVVIGVDGSPGSESALRWGLDLAAREHAPVRLVHAFEPSMHDMRIGGTYDVGIVITVTDRAQALLDTVAARVRADHPDLDVTTRLVDDDPGAALVDESDTAALVVIGTHGVGMFSSLVAGTTAMHLARHARCTVVAVPERAADAVPGRGIVVGVDGSPISTAAVGFAFHEAAVLGEPLTAVHAWIAPLTDATAGWRSGSTTTRSPTQPRPSAHSPSRWRAGPRSTRRSR